MKKLVLRWIGFFVLFFVSICVNAQGDNCSNALVIANPASFCTSTSYSNASATPNSEGLSNSTCWPSGTYQDVWFTFTAVGTA